MEPYLFKSKRLGFRNWVEEDIPKMASISANPEVMKYFPYVATYKQTEDFIHRMQAQFQEHKFCYFAVELLDTNAFIGFIGLLNQTYEAPFTPCIDIGWRLAPDFWNKGLASEGAKRCLHYAFSELKLTEIIATTTVHNKASIKVMEKIGMKKKMNFEHPKLKHDEKLKACVCYEVTRVGYD